MIIVTSKHLFDTAMSETPQQPSNGTPSKADAQGSASASIISGKKRKASDQVNAPPAKIVRTIKRNEYLRREVTNVLKQQLIFPNEERDPMLWQTGEKEMLLKHRMYKKRYFEDENKYLETKYMPEDRVRGNAYSVNYWYYLHGKKKELFFDDDGHERDSFLILIVKDKNGQEKITKQFNAATGKWHFVFTLEMQWPGSHLDCPFNLQFFHGVNSCTEANDVMKMCSDKHDFTCYNKRSALNLAETVYRQIRFKGSVEVISRQC